MRSSGRLWAGRSPTSRRARTLRAAPALREFWLRRGDAREALRWTARMLDGDLDAVPPDLVANACAAFGFGSQLTGDLAAGLPKIERAIELAREGGRPESLVFALFGAAQGAFEAASSIGARRHATEAWRCATEWRALGAGRVAGHPRLHDAGERRSGGRGVAHRSSRRCRSIASLVTSAASCS